MVNYQADTLDRTFASVADLAKANGGCFAVATEYSDLATVAEWLVAQLKK